MFVLILTLCLANGHCYASAPMAFDSMSDCVSDMLHMRASGQVGPNRMTCHLEH